MQWPWTNMKKELEKRLKEAENSPAKMYTVEEVFEHIRNSKPPSLWKRFYWNLNEWAWNVYRFFKPQNNHIRKIIPRQWADIDQLLLLISFAMIKFYYEEDMENVVWGEGTDLECKTWLDKAYTYITIERPQLQKDITKGYAEWRINASEISNLLDTLEKLVKEKDDEVLYGLVKYREYLWS